MTIKASFEILIDKRIDVVLARLEQDITDTLSLERFEFADFSISYYAVRKENTIEINSRILEKSADELHEGESVAKYEVSRVTEIADDESYNRSILKFTCDVDHLQYEKIAHFYLARLGIAFKTPWASEINKTLEAIKADIEKEQGGHWGWTDWKVDEKTGRESRMYGLIPNNPVPAENPATPQPVETDVSTVGFDISGSFEVPVEWDVLASISDKCLDGYAPGFVEKEIINKLPASTAYRIWQEDLGDLGIVEIAKLRSGFSEINISGVSLNSVDNSPMWKKAEPEWDKKKRDALNGTVSKEESIIRFAVVAEEIDKIKAEIFAKQKNHQADVIRAYFNHLVYEAGIWKPNYPPPYILAIGGFTSLEDAYKRGKYFGDFIKGALEAASLVTAPRNDHLVEKIGVSKLEKQKRGAQVETEFSLKRLREIRLEAIRNNRPIPTKTAAMNAAGITDKTWKKYDLELWAKWDDKTYAQEKQE